MCGLARILLVSCVIASQHLARRGGGSRARADSLRTPSVLLKSMGALAQAVCCAEAAVIEPIVGDLWAGVRARPMHEWRGSATGGRGS